MDRFEVQEQIEQAFSEGLEKDELKKRMFNIYVEYAKFQKITLNTERADIIIEGLIRKKETNGKFYCPCRIVAGNDEEDDPKVCPCIWSMDEINDQGHCHCNLFTKG
ncbi:MAG: ferredoxin:thioredoxin reductase [Nanoarchaeota archaeon]|nr:ferredoxin:thioredoxin reductase [Nanoarchaeota archaeon]